jgi:uncharacterized OB-fold protein
MPEASVGIAPAQIRLQRCQSCGRQWQTSFPACPYCGSTALGERMDEGRGVIYSWVEVCRSLDDPPAAVPYTVVCVELESGARVLGRYPDEGGPRAGARVVAVVKADGVLTFALSHSEGQP